MSGGAPIGFSQSTQAQAYTFTAGTNTLQGEVASTVGTSVTLNSKSYTAAPGIKVYIDGDKTVKVYTDGFIEEVNNAATTKVF